MTEDRRYGEEEVRQIFDKAAKSQDATGGLPSEGGMSLEELRRIGVEVGIRPEHVERAARSLDARRDSGRIRVLGLPIGVARSVELDRPLSEAEWERLVVDLRETFDARGRMGGAGSFKQWTNGNLQALLEPAGPTHRLRLRTRKGSAQALITAAGILTVLALVSMLLAFFGTGGAGSALELGLVGAALFGAAAVQLPGWAARRERQMEEVAQRALLMSSVESHSGIPESPDDG